MSIGAAVPRTTESATSVPFLPRILSRAASTVRPSSETPSTATIVSPALIPAFSDGEPSIGLTTIKPAVRSERRAVGRLALGVLRPDLRPDPLELAGQVLEALAVLVGRQVGRVGIAERVDHPLDRAADEALLVLAAEGEALEDRVVACPRTAGSRPRPRRACRAARRCAGRRGSRRRRARRRRGWRRRPSPWRGSGSADAGAARAGPASAGPRADGAAGVGRRRDPAVDGRARRAGSRPAGDQRRRRVGREHRGRGSPLWRRGGAPRLHRALLDATRGRSDRIVRERNFIGHGPARARPRPLIGSGTSGRTPTSRGRRAPDPPPRRSRRGRGPASRSSAAGPGRSRP